MRLLPGLPAAGSIDLSTYESDQSFQITITDSIGNLLTPELADGQETYTLDGQSGENSLTVTLAEPVSESEIIEWYVDGSLDESVEDTNASMGEYTLTFQSGSHSVTAIVRDTETAMAVGAVSPFNVVLTGINVEENSIFTFELNEDGASYTVTGLKEGAKQPDPTKFKIPSTYKGLPVTRIADYAFSNREDITGTLVIPDSVTLIGDSAFRYCSGFNGTLTIGNKVETIGVEAFKGCSSFTGSLDIPDSVTLIDNFAFYECSGFNGTLTIGKSVETIGSSAFAGCSNLTGNLVIPDSVTSIKGWPFANCSVDSITVPWIEGAKPEGWNVDWTAGYEGTIKYTSGV